MPIYLDTPGLRLDEGYHLDQTEDFPNKPGSAQSKAPAQLIKHRTSKHRMNDRQRNQTHRLLRVKAFCADHAPDFTNAPAKPGDAKFNGAKTALDALIPLITGRQAVQASGGFGQASTDQKGERQELVELLRTVVRTASAIATDLNNPGIMDRFRMPASNNDVVLANAGDAFADAITELNLASGFTDHGYEGDVVADLRAEAQDVRDAEGAQGDALYTQVGATASLPGLLAQGRDHVKCLDAVIKNRFRNNAEVLGQWKTASHVTALPGTPPPPAPPAPPTPPAG